jgi:PAS domain S-box-containing protein
MDKKLDRIAKAWKNYILQGKVECELNLSIKESWERCSEYEIDPFKKPPVYVLESNNLKERLDKYEELIRIATPVMKDLYKTIKGSNFIVTLTDKEGYILKTISDANFKEEAKNIYLIEGANWHEKFKGTNAIGTVIEEKKALNIYATEHYFEENHFLTCSAAPIFDSERSLLGILNISGNYQGAHKHTIGMVVAAVKSIENQLLLENMQKELIISEKKQRLILNSASDGLFTINKEGTITQINHKGSQLLGLAPQKCIGRKIDDFLPEAMSSSLLKLSNQSLDDNAENVGEEIVWNPKRKKLQVTSKAKRIFNQDDEVAGLVVKINDLSNQDKFKAKEIERRANYSFANIIGNSKEISKVIKIAQKVAVSDSTILLTGESGTGKELFAHAIHNQSFRNEEEFVAVNCGAIPKNLLESELFGYEKGAFTGAQKGGKAGKFEVANGGTIFLDEIGEMDLNAQVKLLRVLQEKKVEKIGANGLTSVNIRIIAATNKDLHERVKAKKFREDLYYRLNVINIDLPPLREREDDSILLAEYLVEKLGESLGKPKVKLSEEVKNILSNYKWPGNIRELENIIERALNLLEGIIIKKRHLPDYLKEKEFSKMIQDSEELLSLKEAEARAIKEALDYFEGNISQAARHLEIGRNTLYRKIKKYNIDV